MFKRLKLLLSRPLSLRKLVIIMEAKESHHAIFDLIYGCKGLRSLHIHTFAYHMVSNKLVGLEQVGNNCTNIEELFLRSRIKRHPSEDLSSFCNLRKLTLKNFGILPPSNIQDWTNLRYIEGNLLSNSLWASAISGLLNLIEIKCEPDSILDDGHQNVIEFCSLCKDKPICNTLEV